MGLHKITRKHKRNAKRYNATIKTNTRLQKRKTLKGGVGPDYGSLRPTSGANKTSMVESLKGLDEKILYFRTVYENMQRFSHPNDADARAMIQSSKELEKHSGELGVRLIDKDFKKMYEMIIARDEQVGLSRSQGKNLSKTGYGDDAELSRLLYNNRDKLDEIVRKYPYLYHGGVAKMVKPKSPPKPKSMFPSVPNEEPSELELPSPPKSKLVKTPTRYEPYFVTVAFFREVINSLIQLARDLNNQSILTEIDKRDRELYEFVNQINLPTYQGQKDAVPRLEAAIERVLAIGRKYNKK